MNILGINGAIGWDGNIHRIFSDGSIINLRIHGSGVTLMMDGELTDPDGKIFKKGDFVTFEPGSKHSSFSKNGCLVLVFMRGINKAI